MCDNRISTPDHVLDRITYRPPPEQTARFAMPTWPAGYAPAKEPDLKSGWLQSWNPPDNCYGIINTYTYAEAEALLRICGAGTEWVNYDIGFASYLPELTDRSPARDAKCQARVTMVSGPHGPVLLCHSMLHLATDGPTIPLIRLFNQLIDQFTPQVFVDTGTGGGMGADKILGDVMFAPNVKFLLSGDLASKPFAKASYPTTLNPMIAPFDLPAMFAANAGNLPPAARGSQVMREDVITLNQFAFDTSTDEPWHLRAYDPQAGAEEMDAACLGYVIDQRKAAAKHVPLWAEARNVSDPQADMSLYYDLETAKKQMSEIYEKYGLYTSHNSVCLAWALVSA